MKQLGLVLLILNLSFIGYNQDSSRVQFGVFIAPTFNLDYLALRSEYGFMPDEEFRNDYIPLLGITNSLKLNQFSWLTTDLGVETIAVPVGTQGPNYSADAVCKYKAGWNNLKIAVGVGYMYRISQLRKVIQHSYYLTCGISGGIRNSIFFEPTINLGRFNELDKGFVGTGHDRTSFTRIFYRLNFYIYF
ncbi:MAG: hypothetical protein IPM77_13085 [Crocinitomicaceae bacterium]|nr:hypothetical protein [Crocinitomicaceae bacterium]